MIRHALWSALFALAVPAQALWAQAGEGVGKAPAGGRWMAYVVSVVLVACIVTASVWGSKRTHQD